MSRRRGQRMERRLHRGELAEVTVKVPPEKVDAVRRYAARARQTRIADRADVIEKLRRHRADLLARFGVVSLSLFGSVARDQAKRESDVDLLVEFAPGRPTGLLEFVGLKHMLEGLLERPVDLVTRETLKPRLKGHILGEAELVF